MNSLERLREAHRLAEEGASRLTLGNDPASGFKLLATATLTGLAHVTSNDEVADMLEQKVAQLRQSTSRG